MLLILFTSLGVWQVERLSWKRELITRVDARLAASAVAAPSSKEWADLTRDTDEYRRVTISGKFLHEDETLVQAVTELGGGYWVMTPLVTPEGSYQINRGFVPSDHSDPASRSQGQVQGRVTITGLIRISEPKGGFLRENDPAQGRWYSRDVGAISADIGVTTAPFFIDADATPNPGGYPIGGLTVVNFRNAHLSYALTWFALAIGTLAASFLFGRHEWRQRRAWPGT
ncbi:MAG: SURF1 family protein [Rhodobacterales bacterium]|uniref:SURF1 family protein n=1 Tax=Puniceibacterium antarcticum TaxID=1206336 RepID=UPI001FE4C30B|nr:SURF1 family protein [Puniceibacterium antarcticum]